MTYVNALVAQGGGPTVVINQSLVGIALQARVSRRPGTVHGALHGIRGIVDETLIDLSRETAQDLEAVADTPSAALGSTRDKPDLKYCREILRVLKSRQVGEFYYIGGNDSAETLRLVSQEARKETYPLRCLHVPKTIDNDLLLNDHTPGFPSAARFVVQAFMGINLDNLALPGVYVGVVMGREAGFLTAASALARHLPDDGPHLIYPPERPFSLDAFLARVRNIYGRLGRCVVAISEGVRDPTGRPIAAGPSGTAEHDQHGNVQLSGSGALSDLLAAAIKTRLSIERVRADTFGYLQRSFAGCVSDVDSREAREVGKRAVLFAQTEGREGSVTITRTGYHAVDYGLAPLASIAGKTRFLPDEFIGPDGADVTEAFRGYLRPLLGSGLPRLGRLNWHAADRP